MGRLPGSGGLGIDLHPATVLGVVGLAAVLLLCRSILVRTLRSKTNLFYPVFIGCCLGSIALVEGGVIRGIWIDSVSGVCVGILVVVELVLYSNE